MLLVFVMVLPQRLSPAAVSEDMSDDECLRLLIASARSGRAYGDKGGHRLDGVFRRMLDPAEFRRLVYPGLAQEQRDAAPKSLQEV